MDSIDFSVCVFRFRSFLVDKHYLHENVNGRYTTYRLTDTARAFLRSGSRSLLLALPSALQPRQATQVPEGPKTSTLSLHFCLPLLSLFCFVLFCFVVCVPSPMVYILFVCFVVCLL